MWSLKYGLEGLVVAVTLVVLALAMYRRRALSLVVDGSALDAFLVGFAFLLAAQVVDLAHAATEATELPLLKLALFGVFVIATGVSGARLGSLAARAWGFRLGFRTLRTLRRW